MATGRPASRKHSCRGRAEGGHFREPSRHRRPMAGRGRGAGPGSRRAARRGRGSGDAGLMARLAGWPLLLCALMALAGPSSAEAGDGGWRRGGPGPPEEALCTVERRADLSYAEFVQRYAFQRPVVLRGLTDNSWTCPSRSTWSGCCGPRTPPPWAMTPCTSSATTTSPSGRLCSGTTPRRPTACWARRPRTASAWQRWFLYPPEKTPQFHPNETTLAWLRDTYPGLAPAARPLECTISAGEVLYFPARWWHATLNLDTCVFISTFLG
ncbi:jmjC domain-containing protein 8 isoform X2 [Oryctolagus cuniculus]|uniref:jmjC domain-containing protein 8 isoform X2 n=1 Tax=Oryctolagus cuniculus TaxID=9986 RepID=UPI0022302E5F|nr:jmjC domain-containing protein 8 isoform X2 [Oryctolagus cuniculus]